MGQQAGKEGSAGDTDSDASTEEGEEGGSAEVASSSSEVDGCAAPPRRSVATATGAVSSSSIFGMPPAASLTRTIMKYISREASETEERFPDVKCPNDHIMGGRVLREVIGPCCYCRCCCRSVCMHCGQRINMGDGYYRCNLCNVEYCMRCAEEMSWEAEGKAMLPGPGDIILCGPFATITHVILATGPMERDEAAKEWLKTPEGAEVYSCATLESTPFYLECLGGTSYADEAGAEFRSYWFRAHTYYQRDPATGEVQFIGVRPWRNQDKPQRVDPRLARFVFHPFRRRFGGPELNESAFREAVRKCEMNAARYGFSTVLRGLTAARARIDASRYQSGEERARLMQEIRQRWRSKPICASVAIMVWQAYFDVLHGELEDEAARDILRWVPVFSDKTFPSTMVKVLGQCGWKLAGDIRFGGPAVPPDSEEASLEEAEVDVELGASPGPASAPSDAGAVPLGPPPPLGTL